MRDASPILIQMLIMVGCATADLDGSDGGVSEVAVIQTHDPEICPGGGTGGDVDPGGGPGDQPTRKKCSRDQGLEACLDCCYYNHDHVDGWKCNRIKGDSQRQRARRRKCWEDAAEELGRCQVQDCGRDRIIITTGEMP